ncbi:hypothetical protein ZYGR_0AD01470 [Zygosaccharomyces rouxii]|uniref:ZYRO0G09350p n=2 Tax=Zygosaccharomyces rouxii TaxID=4956 RepID=C5E031_ZYGRC|nr:uncharacterized protein ZYRO0G09350g [Zygosaccharomyces rouxii]KAH9202459.1 hypothetical protein LQ764DRAFT_25595 [Zygosaccharomyces rouxii]GAV50964.1 hypothetical protein ZYGR_0AD01470 [Zygosaccharomyces rouxii]CAR29465.1 ZYRO0G09350p [Zygosaccharomyces rouxii]
MSRLNESYPHVSDGTAKALVSSTVKVMRYLSNTGDYKVVFKLINALGFFNQKVVEGRLNGSDLEGIDVFTPILQSEEVMKHKLDLVAIFLAYLSIHREFHPLILNSIKDWCKLLPEKKLITCTDTKYMPGFYTVVSLLDQYEEVTPQILQYLELDLAHVLVHVWVPQWLQIAQTPLENDSLADLLLNEAKLDFVVATSNDLGQFIANKHLQKEPPTSYFIYKICKRISLFADWMPSSLYKPAAQLAISHGSSASGLHFDLQVLMEVVDHPELNFFQEPRLVSLLHQATNNLRKVPFHKLHAALGTLGSIQSLPAIINMVQLLLCKFLINAGNVSELIQKADYRLQLHPNEKKWFNNRTNNKYQIPSWFETSLLPPLPPIAKSMFVFDNNEHESEQEAKSFTIITNLLFESLNMVILMNTEMLKQYQWLNIDPLMIDVSDETFNIRHLVAGQFLLLYLIPIIMAAMLSQQLLESQVGILSEKRKSIMRKIIFSNTTRLCETLIHAHGNIALYHLLKLCTKASAEDMVLQGICLELLHHIFFGPNGTYNKQLCLENKLTTQALENYITVWNDGSHRYQPFFEKILNVEQPSVEVRTIPVSELYELLPDHEEILRTLQERSSSTPKSSAPSSVTKENSQQKVGLTSRSGNVGTTTPLTYKYNPYSTPSFEPSKPVTLTPPVSFSSGTYTADTMGSTPDTYTFNPRNNEMMMGRTTTPSDTNNYSTVFNGSFSGEPLSNLSRTIESLNGTPQTPSKGFFSSPWDGSPGISVTPNNSKIVSTGKNYILGGHNRIKNNSRAQSIHIDNFKTGP